MGKSHWQTTMINYFRINTGRNINAGKARNNFNFQQKERTAKWIIEEDTIPKKHKRLFQLSPRFFRLK